MHASFDASCESDFTIFNIVFVYIDIVLAFFASTMNVKMMFYLVTYNLLFSAVSCYLEGRTREQCIARWEALNKNYKRGRWTAEEDVVSAKFLVILWHADT